MAADGQPSRPRWRSHNLPALVAGAFVVTVAVAVALITARPAGEDAGAEAGGTTTIDARPDDSVAAERAAPGAPATGPPVVVTTPVPTSESNTETTIDGSEVSEPSGRADVEGARPGSIGGQWWYETDFDGPLGPEWSLYLSPGHAGWGLRRPDAISVVDDDTAGDGRALRIQATMGTEGERAGLLVSGGMALTGFDQTYGRYEFRLRVDGDPARVTSGVALLWPASGDWPAQGEINMFESWNERETRNPIESNVHRLADDAAPPYDLADVDSVQVVHEGIDGTRWHTYLLDWRPDGVTLTIDGGEPRVLTEDSAFVPSRDMRATLQLDAFDAPDNPGAQPVLQQPISMYVDYFRVDPLP